MFASASAHSIGSPAALLHILGCRYLPGDALWPSAAEWQALNRSVGGRLIAGQPLAQVCYGSNRDEAACERLRSEWTLQQTYFPDPVHVMSPYFLNNSCTPFAEDPSVFESAAACKMGNAPAYAINVSSAADVQAGFRFARDKNVRLVVKNTGHDYLGRSNGQGALSLWTHNLKDMTFLNYSSSQYTGPAVKLGAGVQAFEVYAAAAARGLRFVGGFCPTVGVAGGFVGGGGHGLLMGAYGLASDNTLEFEVVTPRGEHLVVSPTRHSDLFWALNGGGAGTYAVVVSQTTRLHPDGPVAGAFVTVNNRASANAHANATTTANNDAFWQAVTKWQGHLFALDVVPGLTTEWSLTNTTLQILVTLLDGSTSQVDALLAPFLAALTDLRLPFTNTTSSLPNFHAHLSTYVAARSAAALTAAFRTITSQASTSAWTVNGIAGNVSPSRVARGVRGIPPPTAVHPAWRDALYFVNMDVYWDPASPLAELRALERQMVANQDLLRRLTPGGGGYMNEGAFDTAQWRDEYYGPNYGRLLKVKRTHDPDFALYGLASVGSDYWAAQADGRLCRAS
ncbi:FAD binding domain-containing protein [Chaetomium strumarium]|uniref:FAD binding domain-containing protein n=1 Tax=Chaetomium strumarium TaxID=1170767 RepID=A0AAJ0M371_9PEZI|nr:FAD binding domain-containing protein [Chaetomium strumarium]